MFVIFSSILSLKLLGLEWRQAGGASVFRRRRGRTGLAREWAAQNMLRREGASRDRGAFRGRAGRDLAWPVRMIWSAWAGSVIMPTAPVGISASRWMVSE